MQTLNARVLFWLAAHFLISSVQVIATGNVTKNKLLLVSFDGFRWDYINEYKTPNFDKLMRDGVYAKLGARAAFTTKTFPNHYTIVTGLWEESHGIINNKMYDPSFDATFKPGNIETRWWDGGEPIWITAKLQGLKTAVYFWPGSDVKLKGIYPDAYFPYRKGVPFPERVDQAIKWLDNEDVDVVCVYFHEPDGAGHKCGAFGKCVEEKVMEMDGILGSIVYKLNKKNLINQTNLVVVSDHGMTNVSSRPDHIIVLSDILDMDSEVERVPQDGVVAMVIPKKDKLDVVYDKLSRKAGMKMVVYKKENIPDHFHYKNHRRIAPIVMIANEGYYIVENKGYDPSRIGPGEHGYDNESPSMRPIFFARGPDFIANQTLPIFDTVNIYSLLCHLTHITPAPNNGSVNVFKDVLVGNTGSGFVSNIHLIYIALTVTCYKLFSFSL